MANTQPAAAADIPKSVRRLEDKIDASTARLEAKIDKLPTRAELHRVVRIRTRAAVGAMAAAAGAIVAVIAPS